MFLNPVGVSTGRRLLTVPAPPGQGYGPRLNTLLASSLFERGCSYNTECARAQSQLSGSGPSAFARYSYVETAASRVIRCDSSLNSGIASPNKTARERSPGLSADSPPAWLPASAMVTALVYLAHSAAHTAAPRCPGSKRLFHSTRMLPSETRRESSESASCLATTSFSPTARGSSESD